MRGCVWVMACCVVFLARIYAGVVTTERGCAGGKITGVSCATFGLMSWSARVGTDVFWRRRRAAGALASIRAKFAKASSSGMVFRKML